MKYIAH